MSRIKTIHEETIKNNFMFGVVMSNEEHCRDFLEMVFGFPIAKVEVDKEKSLVYHPEYKGVRLDVFAKDENNTRYNIEMQAWDKDDISRRSRYYHSQIDMDLLAKGVEYKALPDTYVIFVCDFDPFKAKKYCYTFKNTCVEDGSILMKDGTTSIFLSTKGENRADVSESMIRFLDYVGAELEDSEKDFGDDFVSRLQKTVTAVKASREMEGRYMTLQELLKDERAEGRAEGRVSGIGESVIKVLSELGNVPEDVVNMINNEENPELLMAWLIQATKSENIEQFIDGIKN